MNLQKTALATISSLLENIVHFIKRQNKGINLYFLPRKIKHNNNIQPKKM